MKITAQTKDRGEPQESRITRRVRVSGNREQDSPGALDFRIIILSCSARNETRLAKNTAKQLQKIHFINSYDPVHQRPRAHISGETMFDGMRSAQYLLHSLLNRRHI